MIKKIKALLRKRFEDSCKNNFSFAQFGEDRLAYSYFVECNYRDNGIIELPKNGFYIDIGAYDPIKYSNTHLLKLHGWKGINIDPNPEVIEKFNKYRPDDINLCMAIDNQKGEGDYFCFNSPGYNTLSSKIAEDVKKRNDVIYLESIKTKIEPLATILNKYCNGQKIDFMNIDAEGFDLRVLQSNDWDKFKPNLIIIEDHQFKINDRIIHSEIYDFLKEKEYTWVSFSGPSYLYAVCN